MEYIIDNVVEFLSIIEKMQKKYIKKTEYGGRYYIKPTVEFCY